jgi:N-acetylmuramoyl-L-alanine amidase
VRILRLGDHGAEILDVQQRLVAAGVPVPTAELGRFGEGTLDSVRAFQARRNLRVDGLVGPDTWGQLVEAGYRPGDRTLYLHVPHMRGDDVRDLQRKLNVLGFDAGKEDGVFGPATDRAVREFQRNVGEIVDGVVGLHTLDVIERMRPLEGAKGRAVVREAEELRQMRSSLPGQTIAVDPGPAPAPGEPDIALELATSIAEVLTDRGAKPVLLRGSTEGPSPSERARAANELGAALCVSLLVTEGRTDLIASSFGSAATHSPAGEHLAGLILRALGERLGQVGHAERLTISMLRETRMPAVQITWPARTEVEAAAAAISEGIAMFFDEGSPG